MNIPASTAPESAAPPPASLSSLDPTTQRAFRRGQRRTFSKQTRADKWWLALMVAIPATLHILLVWVPATATVILSFLEWDNLLPLSEASVVGFQNYWIIFTVFDNLLFPSLFNNFMLIFWLTFCSVLGMGMAYLLDKNVRGTRFYQSVYYFPVVLSLAVVGFIWKSTMFSADTGLLNILWPGDPIDLVGDNTKIFEIQFPYLDFPLGLSRNFAALMVAMLWRHSGYIMVMYLAGLKAVDPALREASAIDGCNEWQAFRHVVFPALKPINVVVVVITVIEALRAYDIIAALNEPRGTEVMGTLVTKSLVGEGGGRVGVGSAYGVVLLVLCIGFIIWYVANHYRESER